MPTTYVQHRSTTVGEFISDPIALAFNSNVTAGSTLFMFIVITNGTTPIVSGITDSLSNTWAVVAAAETPTWRIECWKAPSPSGGANTVTVDLTGAVVTNEGVLTLYEFSGMGTTTNGPSNTLDINSVEDPLTLATLTTTAAGVILTGVRVGSAFSLVGFGDSFTDSGSGARARTAYRVTTGGVSAAPTMDCTANENGESLTVAIYEEAAAGGQPTMRRWGGVPFMGGQGIGQQGGSGGRMWGRTREGVIVPRRLAA